MKISGLGWIVLMPVFFLGCSSSALKYSKSAQLVKNDEFENAVKIEHTEPDYNEDEPDAGAPAAAPVAAGDTAAKPSATTPKPATPAEPGTPGAKSPKTKSTKKVKAIGLATGGAATSSTASTAATSQNSSKTKKPAKKSKGNIAAALPENGAAKPTEVPATASAGKREPDIEDDAGFVGRRPVKDPFRIGEVVTHNVHYFKVSAGTLKLKVDPMVTVNGRKAYNFVTEVKSSSVFSSFYSVEDRVENFVDFETLVPRVFSLHVKETSQLREARMIFDEKALKATYWEKKVTDKNGEEEKKQSWEILPFSQNVFSAAFYMRNFQWDVGKEISFRVADDEQNLVFKAKCLRRETLDTALGPMKALVLKPEVTLKGAFKPVGDIYIWLSDDDRKYVLRIESKIKIGTIISEVIALKPGRN